MQPLLLGCVRVVDPRLGLLQHSFDLCCLLSSGPHHNGTGGMQLYHRDSSSDTANSSLMYSGSVLVCDTINTECEGLEGAHRTTCLIPFLGQLALPAGDSLSGDGGFDFFNVSGHSGIGGDPALDSGSLAGNGTVLASPNSSTPRGGLSHANIVVLACVLGGGWGDLGAKGYHSRLDSL